MGLKVSFLIRQRIGSMHKRSVVLKVVLAAVLAPQRCSGAGTAAVLASKECWQPEKCRHRSSVGTEAVLAPKLFLGCVLSR